MRNSFCQLATTLALFILFISTQVAAEEKLTLAMENADIRDLIRWASEHIDKNIIIHPNVTGKITVLAGEPMTKEEAYQVFLSVLQVHGYIVVESEGSLKVLPDSMATQSSIPLADGSTEGEEDIVVRIVKIKNVAATQLVGLLKPLIPQVGHLAAYAESNSLIISDRASNVGRIMEIISRLDRVGVIDIETIPIEFANAKDVVAVVKQVLPATNKGGDNSQALTITADDRSNAILMSGDPNSRQQIRNLIEHLDKPLAGDGNTQVIYVNYASAKDLVPILKSVSGNALKAEKDQSLANVEVGIDVSEETNALIITAPPSILKTMKGVIQKLDIRRTQVLVEAVIVEISSDLAEDLGIEWQSSENSDVVSGFSSIPGNVATGSFPRNRNAVVTTDAKEAETLELGTGLNLGFYRKDSLRAFLRALEVNSSANILSKPTIVALDNEEAEILVGENVPFITGSAAGSNNENPFTTIQRQDIGVTLKIKPRVNNDNSITLEIQQSVESIGTAAVETADIITKKRNINTKVLIDDDEVLVLGGLIRDEVSDTESRIPLLGSIPFIGALFRSNSTATVKKNLMVFIHPKILHDARDNRTASQNRYENIAKGQTRLNDSIRALSSEKLPVLEAYPAIDEIKSSAH